VFSYSCIFFCLVFLIIFHIPDIMRTWCPKPRVANWPKTFCGARLWISYATHPSPFHFPFAFPPSFYSFFFFFVIFPESFSARTLAGFWFLERRVECNKSRSEMISWMGVTGLRDGRVIGSLGPGQPLSPYPPPHFNFKLWRCPSSTH